MTGAPGFATDSGATPGGRAQPAGQRRSPLQRAPALLRWESLLLVILAFLVVEGARLSKFFLTGSNFSNLVSAEMEVAIVALPMTLIIITGEIDLSVESMIGLSGAILGWLWSVGVPLQVGIPVVLVVGALGGLLNGLLVARVGVPSLVVTLGTLALFRGLANVVLGPNAISDFPAGFTAFGFDNIPGTPVPWTLIVFAVLGVVFWLAAHGTWMAGRCSRSARTRTRLATPESGSAGSRLPSSWCPD